MSPVLAGPAAAAGHVVAGPAGHVLAAVGEGPSASAHAAMFWFLAVVSVGSAVGMVLAKRAVHCAMLLAAVMLSLAVFYAMQGAPFLAFVQVIVYTGAVLMLFLFVLMLIGVSSAESLAETIRGQRLAAVIAGLAMVVLLALGIGHAAMGPAQPMTTIGSTGNLTGIATLIFTTYVFPFEVTSALLITAALGAMVLAHRERTSPKPTQRELSRRRVASGHLTPLPPPGTYALHNAVDMPALLPDGTPSELSVSQVIARRELGGTAGETAGLARGAGSGETAAGQPRGDGPGKGHGEGGADHERDGAGHAPLPGPGKESAEASAQGRSGS